MALSCSTNSSPAIWWSPAVAANAPVRESVEPTTIGSPEGGAALSGAPLADASLDGAPLEAADGDVSADPHAAIVNTSSIAMSAPGIECLCMSPILHPRLPVVALRRGYDAIVTTLHNASPSGAVCLPVPAG